MQSKEADVSSGGKPPRARRRVDRFDPPSPPKLEGIAFVEFTIDQQTEAQLTAMLQQVGFRRVGVHRNKDVVLFAQGEIRIVVNREPDSFAHSYQLLHGPSVCALAIETDDAMAAVGRAESYGVTRFHGRIGPNEHSIPAVRSLDGSLIYFTDATGENTSAFETDFNMVGDSMACDKDHLERVDHIAQALPEGRLDAWVLFYRTLLGLEPEGAVDFPDPYGLVRSKAMSNRERTVRFPLNISESRNTATARSVTNFAGAGVSHIAFSTSDIFTSAEAVEQAGGTILPIPTNYYEDIAARFGLRDGQLDRMRRFNILYDRLGTGEFFQFYTLPFEQRFFFEVVQRSGSYDLYGASNAPVRLAALAHHHGSVSQIIP